MENKLIDGFLNTMCTEKIGVVIFLMNGYQLRGQITGSDASSVVLVTDGRQQVIFRHAISTIVPEQMVTLAT